MTREEAIEYNKNLRMYMQITDKKSEHKFLKENYTALDMAIEALEKINKFQTTYNRVLSAKKVEDVEDLDGDELMLALAGILGCEPKTGHWIKQTDDYHDYYECEHCGIAVGLDDIKNFCPNCGAKMQEVEEQ